MGNRQQILWRIAAGVVGLLVVGFGLTMALRGEKKPVSAPVQHRRTHQAAVHPKAKRGTAKPRHPASTATSEPLEMPVKGPIMANFGWQYSGKLNEWYYNPGVTIAAKPGTKVHAAWGGRVEAVRSDPVNGLTVRVNDGNGFETVYQHLNRATVKAGQIIREGQVVGTVGGADLYARQAGAHLDFEVNHNGAATDPVGYLHPSS